MLKSIWNRIRGLRCIYVILFSVSLSHAAKNWKPLNHEINQEKKIGPTKYSWEKIVEDPQNTLEKNICTHKIPRRKTFVPPKYKWEKVSDPRNFHEKKFGTHEIPTRKYSGSKKYPRRHDGTMSLDPQDLLWHKTHEIQHILKHAILDHMCYGKNNIQSNQDNADSTN